MRYLMREGALLSDNQWDLIDKEVVAEAKKVLVGRRFLSIHGPLGAKAQNVSVDVMTKSSASADFWAAAADDAVNIDSRRFVNLSTIYSDFMISWRDVEDESGAGVQAAADAAAACARREDELIFFGSKDKDSGVDGIFTAKGVHKVKIADWNQGENPVRDVSKALEVLVDAGCVGERALVVATDLWGKMHRIQSGTGTMEIDRVRSLVDGHLFRCSRLESGTAALVYCDPRNMDLVIGQDMTTAYLGNEDMDHKFRVMETLVPRIKRPSAIAILG